MTGTATNGADLTGLTPKLRKIAERMIEAGQGADTSVGDVIALMRPARVFEADVYKIKRHLWPNRKKLNRGGRKLGSTNQTHANVGRVTEVLKRVNDFCARHGGVSQLLLKLEAAASLLDEANVLGGVQQVVEFVELLQALQGKGANGA